MKMKPIGRALTTLGLLALPEPKVFMQRQVAQAQDAVKRFTLGIVALLAAAFLFLFALIWASIAGHAALQENWSRPQAAMGVAGTFVIFGIVLLLIKKFALTKRRAPGT